MTIRRTSLNMVLAIAVIGSGFVPTAMAADSSGNCAGTWLGAFDVAGKTATVLVCIPPGMDTAGTTVAFLDLEKGPVAAETKAVSVDADAGIVTVVVAGDAFGAKDDMTLTLRKPQGELLGSAANTAGDPVAPLFTVSRITPELAAHLKKSAGLEGGVPKGLIEALETMKAGFESKSIDKVMASISEGFSHYQWPNKAAYRAFIEGAMIQGELDRAEFDMQYAEFTRNDDGTWTVYPIEVLAMFGSATCELTLKQEDDAWRVIGIEVEGI